MINELIKKLRRTADVLEDLLTSIPSENKRASNRIKKSMDSIVSEPVKRGPYKKRKHWMQTAAGKKKISIAMKKSWALKRANEKVRKSGD